MQPNVQPLEFLDSTRALLTEDPRRYRNFGVYWFFVKAALERRFDRHEMPLLRGYVDQNVVERMPKGLSGAELLDAAAEEYAHNAVHNLGRGEVVDPEGAFFTLLDPDMEGS